MTKASQDTLVRVSAPRYDETISSNPAATLKYYDEEDGDLITLGSSRELTEKLEEPVLPPSSHISVNSQHGPQPLEHHVFEIDERDYVRKLWQDIQKSSSNGTGDVPVPQDPGDATGWSVEKKNRLAVLYERRRCEIWTPIAEELGVTWQSVDAMHWALGGEGLARRAYEGNSFSEQFESSGEIAETKAESCYNSPETQQFEEYRAHHLNATRPTQVHLPMPVAPQLFKTMTSQATPSPISAVAVDHSSSSNMGNNGEVNLTVEGKRQAQAAGELLRARATVSSHRKGAMTAVDSHQNRWASYKSPTSAFLPKASAGISQVFDGPSLTSESKRQAQVAGDKFCWRTDPIRSKPSHAGSLEHSISRNRWSSYSGTCATRFNERQDAQEEASDIQTTTNADGVPKEGQPSLLEIFEAELAKKSSAATTEEIPKDFDIPSETQTQPLHQGLRAPMDLINEHLQELTAGSTALSQDFSTTIDHGIRTAVNAFMHGIARGLQEVSKVSRQAADRNRGADVQLMDNAILGFQSLTEGFTAVLGTEMAAERPVTTSASLSGPADVESSSSSTTLDTSHRRGPNEEATTARKKDESSLNRSVDASETAYSLRPNHAAVPKYISEIAPSSQLDIERQPRSRPAMDKEPRFHKPGPIHLPSRLGYVDHLRQSTRAFDERYNNQHASSPPVDTHFPTLTQFEEEDFEAPASFPALPGMEPLIPQRAPCQSKAGESGSARRTHSYFGGPNVADASQRSHYPILGPRERSAQQNRHTLMPLSRLNSAARLAGPFDPLEAEPSARANLADGLRRNATIASTDIRHAARCRRPYSEVFDGSGRVAWSAFLQDNGRGSRGPYGAREDSDANLEHSETLSRCETGSRGPPLAAAGYDDQHHDDSTVGKINGCVEQLRDLGFGGNDDDSAGRLLVYAQAADGVLADAIDMIDEEQRAYKERP